MASQRASVISSGFSTTTCLPARAAATAGSRWLPLGVQIVTTSTSGSASRSARSSWARQPHSAANLGRRCRRPALAGDQPAACQTRRLPGHETRQSCHNQQFQTRKFAVES